MGCFIPLTADCALAHLSDLLIALVSDLCNINVFQGTFVVLNWVELEFKRIDAESETCLDGTRAARDECVLGGVRVCVNHRSSLFMVMEIGVR